MKKKSVLLWKNQRVYWLLFIGTLWYQRVLSHIGCTLHTPRGHDLDRFQCEQFWEWHPLELCSEQLGQLNMVVQRWIKISVFTGEMLTVNGNKMVEWIGFNKVIRRKWGIPHRATSIWESSKPGKISVLMWNHCEVGAATGENTSPGLITTWPIMLQRSTHLPGRELSQRY